MCVWGGGHERVEITRCVGVGVVWVVNVYEQKAACESTQDWEVWFCMAMVLAGGTGGCEFVCVCVCSTRHQRPLPQAL